MSQEDSIDSFEGKFSLLETTFEASSAETEIHQDTGSLGGHVGAIPTTSAS